MANSLLNTAQQLKGMIEHAKLQAEAAKDAAITQVKLQAEAEKKEVSEQRTLLLLLQTILRQTILSNNNNQLYFSMVALASVCGAIQLQHIAGCFGVEWATTLVKRCIQCTCFIRN